MGKLNIDSFETNLSRQPGCLHKAIFQLLQVTIAQNGIILWNRYTLLAIQKCDLIQNRMALTEQRQRSAVTPGMSQLQNLDQIAGSSINLLVSKPRAIQESF